MLKWFILLLLLGQASAETSKLSYYSRLKSFMITGQIRKKSNSNTIAIDESGMDSIKQLFAEQVCLADLYHDFPRLSLQTYAPQIDINPNSNYFIRLLYNLLYIVRWQVNLLYSLWFTTKRRVTVEQLYVNLETMVDSIDNLDSAIDKYIPIIENQIKLLGETSSRGRKWIDSMQLFINSWREIQSKINAQDYAEVLE